MTIANLNQMSATATSNTDVTGVTLVENSMQPSDVNNAIRGLMTILKNFEQGADGVSKLKIGTNWTLEEDGSNNLLVSYNGTGVLKVASNGAITSANDITAFGSI